MLLVGNSGTGKTKFIYEFESLYPRQPHGLLGPLGDKSDYAPVIKADVPGSTTKVLAENLFHAFTGHPAPARSRRVDLQNAVLHHAVQMRTKLLILEEVNQSIDEKTERVAAEVALIIKDLLNAAVFSILLVGTPEAKRLVSSSPELARRVLHVHELHPFRWSDEDERGIFLEIMDAYDDKLTEILGVRSGLSEPDMALRLYAAGNGFLGKTAKLLEVAGGYAANDYLTNGKASLKRKHLADAYFYTALFKHVPNPFLIEDVSEIICLAASEATVPLLEKPKRKRR